MTRPEPRLTAAEAAEILRVYPETVRQLCKTGALKAKKPADRWLIKPSDLEAFIEGADSQDVA